MRRASIFLGVAVATALILILTESLSVPALAAQGEPSDFRGALRDFSLDMQRRHRFTPEALDQALGDVQFQPDIIEAITRPAEAKPWHKYRAIFVTSERARAGLAYWRDHEPVLHRATEKFGVPPEIIVAIIGVETRYGQNTGRYRVVDALSTLAFGYPKRGSFFRNELEQFLLLSREQGIDASDAKGSYAGALGEPQFIPSSYRSYAVDFDGNGRKDLWQSDADAIGSVASYLQRHGWKAGEPVTFPARIEAPPPGCFEAAGMEPSIPVKELEAAGIRVDQDLPPGARASLIRLENERDEEYWLGLNNFYVITRYNHSNLYAMAVYQLGRDILALKREQEGGVAQH